MSPHTIVRLIVIFAVLSAILYRVQQAIAASRLRKERIAAARRQGVKAVCGPSEDVDAWLEREYSRREPGMASCNGHMHTHHPGGAQYLDVSPSARARAS